MDETPAVTRAAAADDAAPAKERGAPCLWFTRLPLRELLEEIRARHFGWLRGPLRAQFAEQERLAECDEGSEPLVSFHAVLNHAQTPVEVFGTLAKRVIWPLAAARRRGKRAMPLPFAAICPEEGFADAWIDLFLGDCVRRGTLEEEPLVRRGWQRQWLESRPLPPALRLRRSEADAALRALLEG